MFSDYPYKLSEEEKNIFEEENPYWQSSLVIYFLVNIPDYSEYKSEKEFLLHRNQKYKILNMTDNELEVEFYEQ